MEKEGFVFLFFSVFLFILLLVTVSAITGEVITGEAITGEVTSDMVGLSVVLEGSPRLTIVTPKNNTYLNNQSLPLEFTAGGEQAVWYNLDGGVNISITNFTRFNTTTGLHTVNLFANNTAGNLTSRNVTFFVNLTMLVIVDDEYDENASGEADDENGGASIRKEKRGESTDFFDYSYEELQNLTGIILDNPDYGKIQFNEAINLTDENNLIGDVLDLNSNTNISEKRIELDSIALSNFDKPATLWFYNLTLSNPRILIDGSVCPYSICTQESYTGGVLKTLKFNVTGFSVYTVDETPVGEGGNGGGSNGGGNGGGGGIISVFSLDVEEIIISLKQGETKKQEVIIKNTGVGELRVEIGVPRFKEFVKISESDFVLKRGESKIIVLDFIAREDTVPDLYVGRIIVKASGVEKEILFAIDVESKKSLFDVKTEILKQFLYVMPGEEIVAEVTLYNLGENGRVDAIVVYIIKDENGNDIITEQESLAVETQVSFVKTLKLPSDIKPGRYILYVRTTYDGEVASASAWFSVVSSEYEYPSDIRDTIFLIVIFLIIIILLFILYQMKAIQKYKKVFKNKRNKK